MKILYGPEPFTYPDGGSASGVTVHVYAQGTTTHIPLYANAAGTVPLANPLTTDGGGLLAFYSDPGFYDLSANGALVTIQVVGPLILAPVVLTDAATIQVDATAGSLMRVTLAGNRILGVPSGGKDGQMLMYEIKQDGVGGRTITLPGYNFGTDLTVIQLSAGPGITDRLLVQYVSARDEWDVIGFKKGF